MTFQVLAAAAPVVAFFVIYILFTRVIYPRKRVAPTTPTPVPPVPLEFGSNDDGQFSMAWSDGSTNKRAVLGPFSFSREKSRDIAVDILESQGHEGAIAALVVFESYRAEQSREMREALDCEARAERRKQDEMRPTARSKENDS